MQYRQPKQPNAAPNSTAITIPTQMPDPGDSVCMQKVKSKVCTILTCIQSYIPGLVGETVGQSVVVLNEKH